MKGYTKMNYEKTVIPPLNKAKMREMKEYMDNLAKPVKGLGRLEELAAHLAGIYQTINF